MKKLIIMLVIAMVFVGGCASTTSKVYNSEGKVISEISNDAKMMETAQIMSSECNKAKVRTSEAAVLGLTGLQISKLAPSAQAEYMRSLPMMQMAQMFGGLIKTNDGCQSGLTAYYNYKGIQKKANTALWSKGLGIAGVVGGILATGSVLEGIMAQAAPQNVAGDYVGRDGSVNTQPYQEPIIVEVPVLPEGSIPVPLPEVPAI